jgi:MFS family permease
VIARLALPKCPRAYVDHRGRRAGSLLTLGLMAVGTLSIACTPSYASIGLLAPLLVLAGRLVQGLSAGAENGGVSVYLSEIAAPGCKGFYVSWQTASQQLRVISAALLGPVTTPNALLDEARATIRCSIAVLDVTPYRKKANPLIGDPLWSV